MTSGSPIQWLIRVLAAGFGLLLAWVVAGQAVADDGPRGLAGKIPADAIGFLHLDAAAFWKSDCGGVVRDIFGAAGPDALEALAKRYEPSPRTLVAAAAFALAPGDDHTGAFGLLLGFEPPFDPTRVARSLLPDGDAMNHFGAKYTADRKSAWAVHVVDNRTLLVAPKSQMRTLLAHEKPASGNLSAQIATAASRAVTGAVDLAGLPAEWRDRLPESIRPATAAKLLTITGDAGKELTLRTSWKYADAAGAADGEKAIRAAAGQFRGQLTAAADEAVKAFAKTDDRQGLIGDGMNALAQFLTVASNRWVERALGETALKVAGDEVQAEFRIDPASPKFVAGLTMFVYGVALPAHERMQSGAIASAGQNNLKQLALGMHNFHNSYGFCPGVILSPDGKKPLLSWRVAILPFIEQSELYQQFKLNEPWDSDHNKPLIAKMPKIFADPDAPQSTEPGMTHYQVFVGGGGGFRPLTRGTRLTDVTDGTSNSIMIATAADPVVWTRPADINFAYDKPLPKLGLKGKPANVAMFDGSVCTLPANVSANRLRKMITIAAGELLGDDD